MNIKVTPWSSENEFSQVAKDILSLSLQGWRNAKETIDVWEAKSQKFPSNLPIGIQTSLALIQTRLTLHDHPELPTEAKSLLIAGANTRFINHICKLAEKRYGITKMGRAVRKLGLPDKMVHERHAYSHKNNLPIVKDLLISLDNAVKWLIENYWKPELQWVLNEAQYLNDHHKYEYNSFRYILECYSYFRIYQIWGNKRFQELQNQTDVYEHVSEMWENFRCYYEENKMRTLNPIESLTINQAVALLRNEFEQFLSKMLQLNNNNCQSVIQVLIQEELLLPNEDFLESVRKKEDQSSVLPNDLASLWTDILKILIKCDLLPYLFKALYDCSMKCKYPEKNLSCAWIIHITNSLQKVNVNQEPPKKKRKKETRKLIDNIHGTMFNEFFLHCIRNPCNSLKYLFPYIVNLYHPRISRDKEDKLLEIIDIYLGKHLQTNGYSIDEGDDDSPFTIKSFLKDSNETIEETNNSSEDHHWKEIEDQDWSSLPIGIKFDPKNSDDIEEESEILLHFSNNPEDISVTQVNWNQLMQTKNIKKKAGKYRT